MSDTEILNWIEEQVKKSHTGISFDFVPACEDEPSGFRFMRRWFIGDPAKSLRGCIETAIQNQWSFK